MSRNSDQTTTGPTAAQTAPGALEASAGTTPGGPGPGEPAKHLSIFDAVCVVVGIVIATGIFALPPLVAGNTSGPSAMLAAWALGGLLCLCGSLAYADLAAACPGVGGEYLYLSRSLGQFFGFMFVWARMTVIQTGSIAFLAYVFGDYVVRMTGWRQPAGMYCALGAVGALTAFNAVGLRVSKWAQNALTVAKTAGVLAIAVLGLTFGKASVSAGPVAAGVGRPGGAGAFGLAMVFVLLTYGGWNEAAYVAGELRRRGRWSMLWVLVAGSVLITLLYLGVNFAYLRILGFEALRSSHAVAADAMAVVLGERGAVAVSVLVAVAALGAIDGCIFTGSRAIYAWGNDYPAFRVFGRWNGRLGAPLAALVAQGAIAAVLILLPGLSDTLAGKLGTGLQSAAEYTAPVFWAFLFLTGLAVFVLRLKNPTADRPLGSWAGLLMAVVLCVMSAYMLHSSLVYTKIGALVGVGVLLAGLPVYAIARAFQQC
jgi:amino acid transporter